ncbi:MAG: DinB family protein [Candidatus Dormibacteraceae bacterium]
MAPADLLRPLEGQREETLRVLAGIREEDLDRIDEGTGWSVRRILAHLASAELGQAFLIRAAAEGQIVHMSPEDRDRFNSDEVTQSVGWDGARIRSELEDSRGALSEIFAALDEDDLDRAIRWPEWPARSIRSSIPYMLEHEDSHMDQVRAALGID